MINFKEHDGLLFKMLEENEIVPLTDDAELPVLVRLIQDDSPMGRYNQSYSEYRYGVRLGCCMLPIIATHIGKNGVVNDIEWDINRYEIIGTFVKEGSADWALYQMTQGEKVCHKKFPFIMYSKHASKIMREVKYRYMDYMSIVTWLNWADKNGWQIYTEPEQPKPLLADAQVGDLVKLRNGSYSQIVEVKDGSVFKYQNPEVIGSVALFWCDENGDTSRWGKVKDFVIISTEPQAPEGSAEWALQMMKLGKCVCHVKAPSIKYHRSTHYIKRVVRENCTDDMSDAVWMEGADPTGWQIYTEPKLLLAEAKVGDLCKHRNGEWSQIIDTNGTYIPGQPIRTTLKDTFGINRNFCLSGSHFIGQLGGEYDIIHTEPLAPEGTAEWALQMMKLGEKVRNRDWDGGMHEKSLLYCKLIGETIKYNEGCSAFDVCLSDWEAPYIKNAGWQIYKEPKPEPQYKAGDFVEIRNWYSGYKHLAQIDSIDHEIHIGSHRFDTNGNSTMERLPQLKIIHKLKPSQVVVEIGCLSGTVRPVSTNGTHIWFHLVGVDDKTIATIRISCLDTPTREIVESLLKAQEEE